MEEIVVLIFGIVFAFCGYSHGYKIGYMKGCDDTIDKMKKVRIRK
jgi:hypothetical protein